MSKTVLIELFLQCYFFRLQRNKLWNVFFTGQLKQVSVSGIIYGLIEMKQSVSQGTVR